MSPRAPEHRGVSVLARALLCLLLGATGCERTQTRVDHRANCLVCHAPRGEDGEPHGVEEAHPWQALSCTRCHGGQAFVCRARSQFMA